MQSQFTTVIQRKCRPINSNAYHSKQKCIFVLIASFPTVYMTVYICVNQQSSDTWGLLHKTFTEKTLIILTGNCFPRAKSMVKSCLQEFQILSEFFSQVKVLFNMPQWLLYKTVKEIK